MAEYKGKVVRIEECSSRKLDVTARIAVLRPSEAKEKLSPTHFNGRNGKIIILRVEQE